MNSKLLPMALIILSLSILIGSCWIGYSIQQVADAQNQVVEIQRQMNEDKVEKGLMTREETAKYLRISTNELMKIVIEDQAAKQNLGAYDTYRFIPSIELEGGVHLFNKSELNKWIKYRTNNN